jgi:hypothetical protein
MGRGFVDQGALGVVPPLGPLLPRDARLFAHRHQLPINGSHLPRFCRSKRVDGSETQEISVFVGYPGH